jgi:hypothetical protein
MKWRNAQHGSCFFIIGIKGATSLWRPSPAASHQLCIGGVLPPSQLAGYLRYMAASPLPPPPTAQGSSTGKVSSASMYTSVECSVRSSSHHTF